MLRILAVAIIVLAAGLSGCSGEADHGSSHEGVKGSDAQGSGAAEAVAGLNKVCPVTGEEADPEIFTVYQGKKVCFCCEDCVEDFQKDPAKYFAKAYPDAAGR